MNVFVAGGSGTLGFPLVQALLAGGHQVTALSRSPSGARAMAALGAHTAVADALDRDALLRVVSEARPTHVVHQLTALPKEGPRSAEDLIATNRLRITGTRNLLDAARAAGARRFIAASFAPLAPRGTAASTVADPAADAVRSLEQQVFDATHRGELEGVVLRYGLFYSRSTPSTAAMIDRVRRRRLPIVRHDQGQLPLIHVDDAVRATVLALEGAPSGRVYEIVDDRAVSLAELVTAIAAYAGADPPRHIPRWLFTLVAPYASRMLSMRLPLSNGAAKTDLGWYPVYPTINEGLAQMFSRPA